MVAAVIGAIGFAFPAGYVLWRNITAEADALDLVFSGRIGAPLWRSLKLAVAVSVTAGAIGTGLAWLVARTDIAFARFWYGALAVPLVFPSFIGAAAFIRAMNPGGIANDLLGSFGVDQTPELRGFVGAWLVLSLFTYPYVFMPVAARLRQIPASLEESARLLGDSSATAFRRVVLPQVMPSIGAGMLLVFLYAISDFGAVKLMRYDTLTRAIETNYLARPDVAFALSLVLMGLAAVAVGGEHLFSRSHAVTVDSRAPRLRRTELGRGRFVALLAAASVFALATLAPIVALVDWATAGRFRGVDTGRPLRIDTGDVTEATINTVGVSLATALFAVLAVLPIAILVGRFRSRPGGIAHGIVLASFALPGILIALALRFWTLRTGVVGAWLADTHALLIFAYVVRFGSLAIGVTLIAVRSVPPTVRDAARTLGANRLRRLTSLDLPLMRGGLMAGAGLVLLSTMKELPISLLIAPIGFPTLTTRIFFLFEEAFVTEAGVLALVLVACSFALTWALVLRRSDLT